MSSGRQSDQQQTAVGAEPVAWDGDLMQKFCALRVFFVLHTRTFLVPIGDLIMFVDPELISAANADPKSVRSDNGRPLIAPRRLLLMLVSTPLRTVNRCCSGFPVSGGIL